jgi:hypothetical protein
MNILVQLFWICIAILESDYEHEFLLGLRLLDKVVDRRWPAPLLLRKLV